MNEERLKRHDLTDVEWELPAPLLPRAGRAMERSSHGDQHSLFRTRTGRPQRAAGGLDAQPLE